MPSQPAERNTSPSTVQEEKQSSVLRKKTWLSRLIAIFLGIVMAELALTIGAMISPRLHYALSPPWKRVTVPDEVLGFRMSPFYPGNDRQGYRNKSVLEHCDILAVGASMTYGFAATADKAWPRQLEGLLGKSVYNMSCGGYGPCEYKVLVERGLKLTPNTVVMEMYPGNAVAHAYQSTYLSSRFPDLRSKDPAVQAELARLDKISDLPSLAKELDSHGLPTRTKASGSTSNPFQRWLTEKCALYAVGRALYPHVSGKQYYSILREDQPPQDAFEVAAQRPNNVPFDDPRLKTVFLNPEYLKLGLDLQDPRIRAGRSVIESILQSLQVELQSRGIRFVVVIIPSKQVVYERLSQKQAGTMPSSLFEVVKMEKQLLTNIDEFCKSHTIEYVNALDALCTGLEQGQSIYPQSDDEHLNAQGYKVLATAIAEHLKPVSQ